ncbi:DNA internalization-related competence protein ComEC/Rec2 [Massilia dura]|uniref:DNA internalization-related competence protein ComEC/Rec2 n=1 Tax=Pseudoduganella dura TaxID=321982 RepID=A0A6I3XJ22_9BURK|nr:DNA internalization-related competence protein ComEC/Rec2 [Pseudoduganella dura]MUI16449.1 DNA internalization-related competence protein ComEC/Rec2 [Pseudoduganella dura]GGX86873.1 DNA internalization-related competence protein ComEC/Rec2 [Pseudoduganella dura]
MRSSILGFVGGAALLQTQASLPSHPGSCLMACAVVAALLAWRARGGWRVAAGATCGAALGFCWAALLASHALAPALAKADEGRDVIVTGTVDNLPNRASQFTRFFFTVEHAEGIDVPPRIALSWYSGFRGEVHQVPDLRPGERWRLKVRLQRPHGNANPHGFDYELWLLEQGIRATGYVRSEGPNERLDGFVFTPRNVVERMRHALRDKIGRALAGREYAAVIVALVVGDQRGIDQGDWQVFNRTGISHLVSISGLHITMIAGLVAWAASALWRRSLFLRHAQLPLLLPAQKVGALAGILAALSYVLLAGFGVPAQRTLYMLCVVALALWLDRIACVSHVLALAAGLVVLLDPWAVMWPGFWLSFAAVAVILYASVGRTAVHKNPGDPGSPDPDARRPAPLTRRQRLAVTLKAAVNTQYAVTLGLVPLTMLLFAQVSVISPIANAIAIPVVSLLVTPFALAGGLLPQPLATPLLVAAHELMRWLAGLLQWFSVAPLAVWNAPVPPWWLFALALFGTAWLLAPRGWPTRWLGAFTWVPLLAAQPDAPAPGTVRVLAFDVGQGMAVLVETAGHRLLYDTGPSYGGDANAGSRVIVPYLRARGIGRLDGMVVSHGDADHAGGALAVLRDIRVGWSLSSLDPGHPVARAAPAHRRCIAGQRWEWDGVRFEMLHPTAGSYADASLKTNGRSCTLRIVSPGGTVLLPGDIEARQEAELVARSGAGLRSDILLVPHHGSGTSSTEPFLDAVRPEIALLQVGYRNRYRHPKKEVMDRYGKRGVWSVRSDESGAVTIDLGDGMAIEQYRDVRRRYWH